MEFSKIPSDAEVNAHEKPLFSFSAISDIHLRSSQDTLDGGNGFGDLANLLRILKNRKIDGKTSELKYIFCAGDIGYSSLIQELKTFNRIMDSESNPVGFDHTFSCMGNHDQSHDAQTWRDNMFHPYLKPYVTDQKNFSHVDGDFVFAFMSLAWQSNQGHRKDTSYFDENIPETKNWLKNLVRQSTGKTIILFMHYPLANKQCVDTGTVNIKIKEWNSETSEYVDVVKSVKRCWISQPYAGLLDAGGSANNNNDQAIYGFKMTKGAQDYTVKDESEQIIEILKGHDGKVVVFSGHTHTIFQVEDFDSVFRKGYANINVANIPNSNITTVHIPSLNHPRMLTGPDTTTIGEVAGWKEISGSNPYRQECQSWIVDVYEDKMILRGLESNMCHDKRYGDILEKYTYPIYLTNLQKDNEIPLEYEIVE